MNENTNEMAQNLDVNQVPVTDADDFFYENDDIVDVDDSMVQDIETPTEVTIPEEIQTPTEVTNPEEVQTESTTETKAPESTPVPEVPNMTLSEQDIDKMLAEEESGDQKDLDDSYVLSNFDVLFDSLYNDVAGANNFISNLIEQKKTVNVNEAELNELKEKLEKDRQEFEKYMDTQRNSLELEKQEVNEYVKNQKIRIQNEEEKFNADCDATRAEIALAEQTLKIANEKLDTEKEQFEQYKQLEEEKLNTDRAKLQTEREQFSKEKTIAEEKIKNGQRELQTQKEQFAKSKELEEKKLELESKNLSQSCARFKELVAQFNSGFQQLPENND